VKNCTWPLGGLLVVMILGFSHEIPGRPEGQASSSRRPVLLVPGWLGRAQDMAPLKQRLVRDGWAPETVFPLEFQDPVGSSLDHSRELERDIEAVLQETGAPEIDLVAHSMGGLAVWTLLQRKGDLLPIRRVVFLATPFQGTVTAYLAWGDGGPEMIPGSEFLQALKRGGWPEQWVEALAIRTPLDLTVVPAEGATPLESRGKVICCPTHQGLLDHEETYEVIRDFLLASDPEGTDGPYGPRSPGGRGEIDPLCEIEITLGDASGGLSGEGQPHHGIPDVDVGPVPRLIRETRDSIHEHDGVAEGFEMKLLDQSISLHAPAGTLLQPPLDRLFVQLLAHDCPCRYPFARNVR